MVSSGGRLGSERFVATSNYRRRRHRQRYFAPERRQRHSVRDGAPGSLPIGYARRRRRHPRAARHARHAFGVDMHYADVATVRNLMRPSSAAICPSKRSFRAYMAGLACLADDEADLGPARIDMGAGTHHGGVLRRRFVHADGLPGRHHVTMDLARGLNTRVSMLADQSDYGSVCPVGRMSDMITVPPVGTTSASRHSSFQGQGWCASSSRGSKN